MWSLKTVWAKQEMAPRALSASAVFSVFMSCALYAPVLNDTIIVILLTVGVLICIIIVFLFFIIVGIYLY